MGKYYTIIGNSLYIYVTGNDLLLDIKLFPKDLHLFDSESNWRMTDKVAIVNGARDSDIAKAEIILNINAYKRYNQPDKVIETYFTTSDESVFDNKLPSDEDGFKIKDLQRDFEVIIPEARPPVVDYAKKIQDDIEQNKNILPNKDEDIVLEKVLKRIEENLSNRKQVQMVPKLTEQNMIPIKTFEETISLFNKMMEKIITTPDTINRVEASLEALNHKLSEYISDGWRIQEKQLEAWNASLDRLNSIFTENIRQKEPLEDNISELEKKIDEFLGIPEFISPNSKANQQKLIIKEKNSLEEILASLLNKNESNQSINKTPEISIDLQNKERVNLDKHMIVKNLEENYRYIVYSKYFSEIVQRSSEVLENLESNWSMIESVLLKIAEEPQSIDLQSLPKIEMMTPESALKMTEELEALRDRIKGIDTRLSIKLEELLHRLGKKQTEKPLKSIYDIPENRILKKGIHYIQEKTNSLLNYLEYNTHFIMKTIKSSDYIAMVSLAQSLLDNRARLNKTKQIKQDITKTLNYSSFSFLDEVEVEGETIGTTTLDETYRLFNDLIENLRSFSHENYEINIQEIPKNLDRLYETWCFTKIIEETIGAGYIILDDNMIEISEKINIIHNEKSFISLKREDKQLRIYYANSELRMIVVEILDKDNIINTIKFQPRLEKINTLKLLEGDVYLIPNNGDNKIGIIKLIPGGSSENLKKLLNL